MAYGSKSTEKLSKKSSRKPSTSKRTLELYTEFRWPKHLAHPLLIPNVAKTIMEYSMIREVERGRLVCSSWSEEACAVLRDKKIVALSDIDTVDFYLQKMKNTIDFPHSYFEFQMDISERQEPMERFWTKFGSHIKSLDLQCTDLGMDTFLQIMSQRLQNLEFLHLHYLPQLNPEDESNEDENHSEQQGQPAREPRELHEFTNLKKLSLYDYLQDEDEALAILKELLQSMPNLETVSIQEFLTLSFTGTVISQSYIYPLLIQNLIDLEVNLPHLKSINFKMEVGNLELEGLTRKRYPFEELSLKLKPEVDKNVLHDFLAMVTPTMCTMEIVFSDVFFSKWVNFPVNLDMSRKTNVVLLTQIRKLSLQNFQGSLSFVKGLNELKTLSVINADQFTGDLDLQFNGLDHKLEHFRTDYRLEGPAISAMCLYFPFLRSLQIKEADDQRLGIIYRNLPFLVTLDISEGTCTDEGISGVPTAICNDMAATAVYRVKNPGKYRNDLFIGCLQYLRNFKISSDGISDIGVGLGIVDCPNLESLTLRSSSITDQGVAVIADCMRDQLKFLDIGNCKNVTEAGKFYVKERLKGTKLIFERARDSYGRIQKAENPYRQEGARDRRIASRNLNASNAHHYWNRVAETD